MTDLRLPREPLNPPALRIVYMGTPDFAVPTLEALLASRHEVVAVCCNPDRRSGRGNKLKAPPVKVVAERAGIEVLQPKSMRRDIDVQRRLAEHAADVYIVAAYGMILPASVLAQPRYGSINVHASLLPKLRGAAPINWAIVRGHARTGVTIMLMEEGLDTGPMLLTRAIDIGPRESAQQLHDRLAPLGAEALLEALDLLTQGALEAEPQDDAQASWAPMLHRDDGALDWRESAQALDQRIRGFSPWPGTFARLVRGDETHVVKVHRARVTAAVGGEPGEVVAASASSERLIVACGQRALALEELQVAGRRAMTTRDFLNGFAIELGERFALPATSD